MSPHSWHGLSHKNAWSDVGDSYSKLAQSSEKNDKPSSPPAYGSLSRLPAGVVSRAKPKGAGSFQLQVSFTGKFVLFCTVWMWTEDCIAERLESFYRCFRAQFIRHRGHREIQVTTCWRQTCGVFLSNCPHLTVHSSTSVTQHARCHKRTRASHPTSQRRHIQQITGFSHCSLQLPKGSRPGDMMLTALNPFVQDVQTDRL